MMGWLGLSGGEWASSIAAGTAISVLRRARASDDFIEMVSSMVYTAQTGASWTQAAPEEQVALRRYMRDGIDAMIKIFQKG